MEFLSHNDINTPTKQPDQISNSEQMNNKNTSYCRRLNNRAVFKLAKSNSATTVIDTATFRNNDQSINYPSTLSILIPFPVHQMNRLTKLNTINTNNVNNSSKSRNVNQIKQQDQSPFILRSTDNIHNNINIVNNSSRTLWKTQKKLEKELEYLQRLSPAIRKSKLFDRKPFGNEFFLKISKNYGGLNKDSAIYSNAYMDEFRNYTYKLSKDTYENTNRMNCPTNLVLHDSKSEKRIILKTDKNQHQPFQLTSNKSEAALIKCKSNDHEDAFPYDGNINHNENRKRRLSWSNFNINTKKPKVDKVQLLFNKKKIKNHKFAMKDIDNSFNQNHLDPCKQWPDIRESPLEQEKSNSKIPITKDSDVNYIQKALNNEKLFSNKKHKNLKMNEIQSKMNNDNEVSIENSKQATLISTVNMLEGEQDQTKANINRFPNGSNMASDQPKLKEIESLNDIKDINSNNHKQTKKKSLGNRKDTAIIHQNSNISGKTILKDSLIEEDKTEKKDKKIQIDNQAINREMSKEEDIKMTTENNNQKEALKKTKKSLKRGETTSKQSDLKTDTDSKGRNSKNNNTTERHQGVGTLTLNQKKDNNKIVKKTKDKQYKDNIKILNSNKEFLSIATKVSFVKITFKNKINKKESGSKYLDQLMDQISSSLLDKEDIVSKNKNVLLLKKKLEFIPCRNNNRGMMESDYERHVQGIQLKIREETWNNMDMDYKVSKMTANCCISFSLAAYIFKTYLLIDSVDFSDYLFNVKSNLITNYSINCGVRKAQTKKSPLIILPTLSNVNNVNIKSFINMLFMQRFIKHDSYLAENMLFFNMNESSQSFICYTEGTPMSPKKRIRKLTTNKSNKSHYTLDILKNKPFFDWRKQMNNRTVVVKNSLKLKTEKLSNKMTKIVHEINEMLITNKITYGTNQQIEILEALLSPILLFDLLIKLIQSNAGELLNKCLAYKQDFDLNMQDANGNTLLICAIKGNSFSTIEILLKRGSDPNIQNVLGNTAFHYAVSYKNFPCIDILTRYGGREDILNNNKLTPWEAINKNLEEEE